MAKDDVFDSFEDAIRDRSEGGNPWQLTPDGRRDSHTVELGDTRLGHLLDDQRDTL